MLGLVPLAPYRTLIVDPCLPAWLPELTLHQIQVGPHRASLHFQARSLRTTRFEIQTTTGSRYSSFGPGGPARGIGPARGGVTRGAGAGSRVNLSPPASLRTTRIAGVLRNRKRDQRRVRRPVLSRIAPVSITGHHGRNLSSGPEISQPQWRLFRVDEDGDDRRRYAGGEKAGTRRKLRSSSWPRHNLTGRHETSEAAHTSSPSLDPAMVLFQSIMPRRDRGARSASHPPGRHFDRWPGKDNASGHKP